MLIFQARKTWLAELGQVIESSPIPDEIVHSLTSADMGLMRSSTYCPTLVPYPSDIKRNAGQTKPRNQSAHWPIMGLVYTAGAGPGRASDYTAEWKVSLLGSANT